MGKKFGFIFERKLDFIDDISALIAKVSDIFVAERMELILMRNSQIETGLALIDRRRRFTGTYFPLIFKLQMNK